jgi:alpha-ribazole phosphatase
MSIAVSERQQITSLSFLRHGACHDSLADGQRNTDSLAIFRGRTDSPLSESGWQQMDQALRHWQQPQSAINHNWDIILSSPLKRCRLFAEQLAQHLKLPFEIYPAMQEIDFGDWDGQLVTDMQQQFPQELSRFWSNPTEQTPPNGESLLDFHQRVIQGFEAMVKAHQNQHALVICHGGVMRSIMGHCLNMPLDSLPRLSVPHACLTQINIFHQAGYDDWIQLARHQPLPEPLAIHS